MSLGAVDRLLDALGARLPEGACASWAAADGSAPPTDPSRGQPHDPARAARVADLLPGLAQLLRGADGPFADGTGRVLFESDDRILLVSALGPHGMAAIEAGSGLNVALVRRMVDPLLAEFVAEHRVVAAAGQARRPAYRGTGAAPPAALELLGGAPDAEGAAGRAPDSPVPGNVPAEPEPPSLSAKPGEVAAAGDPASSPAAGPASARAAVRYVVSGPAATPAGHAAGRFADPCAEGISWALG